MKKTHRTKKSFEDFFKFLKKKIIIIPKIEIDPYLKEANEISPDSKDTVYLALSLAINSAFWSNDKKLKEQQNLVEVLTTEDILNKVSKSTIKVKN